MGKEPEGGTPGLRKRLFVPALLGHEVDQRPIALLEEAMAAAKGVDIGQYTYYVDLLAARLPELGEEGPAMIERLRAIEVK